MTTKRKGLTDWWEEWKFPGCCAVAAILLISTVIVFLIQIDDQEIERCTSACEAKGLDFEFFDPGGFGGEDCYCWDPENKTSIQLWWCAG